MKVTIIVDIPDWETLSKFLNEFNRLRIYHNVILADIRDEQGEVLLEPYFEK